ncbi:unnamed protein product, partial [Polarella glacialis]
MPSMSCQGDKQLAKTSNTNVRVMVMLSSLTAVVAVLDYLLAELGAGKEGANESNRPFLVETGIVIVCMIIPAALIHLFGNRDAKSSP